MTTTMIYMQQTEITTMMTNRSAVVFSLALSVAVFLLEDAYADRIILKSGDAIDGEILSLDGIVRIDVNGIIYEIERDQIDRIKISDAPSPKVDRDRPGQEMPQVESRNTDPKTVGVVSGLASAALTGAILAANNTKTGTDYDSARRDQAYGNLISSFGGESRTVDARLYGYEEERFSSGAIVAISLGVGVVVTTLINSAAANDGHNYISPYLTAYDVVGAGVLLRF